MTATTTPISSTRRSAGANSSRRGTFSLSASRAMLALTACISSSARSAPLARIMTGRACASRPRIISQRGLSGTRKRHEKYSTAGKVSRPSIQRQFQASNRNDSSHAMSHFPNSSMR